MGFQPSRAKLWEMRQSRGILGVFLGSNRIPGDLDELCRFPWDGQDRLMRRDGYGYELMPLQHDLYRIEPFKEKCGLPRSFLGCF